jgi:uncharacterized phage infection (PIP) family protein YhgE
MDWLTELIQEPTIQAGGGTAFIIILYNIIMRGLSYLSKNADTEGKEADAEGKEADARGKLADALVLVAESGKLSAQANQESAILLRGVGAVLQTLSKDFQAFMAQVPRDHLEQMAATRGTATQLGTLQHGVDRASTTIDGIAESVKDMATQEQIQEINEKLDALIKEVRLLSQMKPLITRVGDRVDLVIGAIAPLQKQLQSLTDEIPKTAPSKPPGPVSKSGAKRKSDELPKVTPDTNDVVPTGG